MKDTSDYGNNIFTSKDAQALRARFVSLLLERDELSQELEAYRLVLEELSDLRRFLADDPAPFTAVAATNGHLATARAQADNDRNMIAARSQLYTGDMAAEHLPYQSNDREHMPADDVEPEPEIAAVDRGEQDAGTSEAGEATPDDSRKQADTSLSKTTLDFERDTLPVVVDSEPPSQTDEPSDADDPQGSYRPPANTLLLKIIELFEASDRPLSRWSVQKRLNLARMPSAELSRLVEKGCLIRPAEGVYALAGRDYGRSS